MVDNASKEDEATILEKKYPLIKVIRSKQNLGFAGGNNLGIQAARGEYLFFVNNDTLLTLLGTKPETSDFLHPLISRFETSPRIGIVCPKIRFTWKNQPIQYAGYTPLSYITMRNRSIGFGEEDHGQYETAHSTPYAHGAAMMVKREAIENAGMMPECYFLYYEELDWSMMMRRSGYEIWYDPGCTIFHKESQTTGIDSPIRTYYITRNRLLFVKRNNQDFTRYISYLYLIGIVAIKDIVRYSLQMRPKLTYATLKGIYHFLKLSIK